MAPLAFGKATPADMVGVLSQLMPLSEILPKKPEIAERTTGQVMGEAAEEMARRNEISREAQDEFAERSHHRAAAAIAAGRFDDEIVPVKTPEGKWVHHDQLVRGSTSKEKLSKLRSVFAKNGTLTAGNSSALTDGASCVLLMSEEKALELGFTPLCYVNNWAYSAVDPADQLLIAPALSMPEAARKAGLTIDDIDLFVPVLAVAGDTPEERVNMAREAKTAIGFYGATPGYAFQFDDLGYEGTRMKLAEALRAGGRDAVAELVTDELLDQFGLVAKWDDMADALIARYKGIASRVVMYLAKPSIIENPANLAKWGEIAKAVRAA